MTELLYFLTALCLIGKPGRPFWVVSGVGLAVVAARRFLWPS